MSCAAEPTQGRRRAYPRPPASLPKALRATAGPSTGQERVLRLPRPEATKLTSPTTREDDIATLDGLEWENCGEVLRHRATRAVVATGETTPALAAFAGARPLLLADLRPFTKGAHADPVVELAALALTLGADRLTIAFGARAWCLDDPVPPVAPGMDLRQRVVAVHGADGTVEPVAGFGALWPFSVDGDEVVWGGAVTTDDAVGWIPSALVALVAARDTVTGTPGEVARQARRCERLGHRLELAPAAVDRIGPVRPTCSSARIVASSPLPSRAAERRARRTRRR